MFRIKICGVTRPEDARLAVEAGADAVGLNFYEKSPRRVPAGSQGAIVAAVGQALPVGVFVNAPASAIAATGLVAVQLHGDEPPAFLGKLPADRRIIRARRPGPEGLREVKQDLQACLESSGHMPHAVLLDASVPGAYGGTGHRLDWQRLTDHKTVLGDIPLILAGGLTPDNIAEAIRAVRPDGVDVASGVESAPGIKDPAKVRDFVAAASEAMRA
ncbi:MAG: phosphoribosylanthranilate isomerase [Planctomycetota bacterium]